MHNSFKLKSNQLFKNIGETWESMKYKYFIIVIACATVLVAIFALYSFYNRQSAEQSKNIIWSKTFGGPGDEEGWFVKETGDKLLALGYTCSFTTYENNSDIWLICLDSNGVELWNKTYGSFADDYGKCIVKAEDGGYIIAGNTYSYGKENSDVYIIKIDENGTEKWEKAIGGIDYDAATFVLENHNQTLVLGNTYSYGKENNGDIWLICLDSNGTELWSKTYGGAKYDDARCIRETPDGGYIIAGETESYGKGLLDIWVLKTDSNGTELWNKTYGGLRDDICNDIIKTSDGKYLISGHTQSFSNSWDAWVIYIDPNGTELWNKTYGGKKDDGASSIIEINSTQYILTGYTKTYGRGQGDLWIIKISSNGAELWNKTYGGKKDDSGIWLEKTKDGCYVAIGYTSSYGKGQSDIWILKIRG